MNEPITRLHRAVNSFTCFILSLPPGSDSPQTWGPREVLAHLVFWHESYVRTVSDIARGGEPQLYTGPGRVLNDLAVQQNAGESNSRLVDRLLAAQTTLEELEALTAPFPAQPLTKSGARRRTPGMLIADVERHIRNHEARLRRQTRPQPQLIPTDSS